MAGSRRKRTRRCWEACCIAVRGVKVLMECCKLDRHHLLVRIVTILWTRRAKWHNHGCIGYGILVRPHDVLLEPSSENLHLCHAPSTFFFGERNSNAPGRMLIQHKPQPRLYIPYSPSLPHIWSHIRRLAKPLKVISSELIKGVVCIVVHWPHSALLTSAWRAQSSAAPSSHHFEILQQRLSSGFLRGARCPRVSDADGGSLDTEEVLHDGDECLAHGLLLGIGLREKVQGVEQAFGELEMLVGNGDKGRGLNVSLTWFESGRSNVAVMRCFAFFRLLCSVPTVSNSLSIGLDSNSDSSSNGYLSVLAAWYDASPRGNTVRGPEAKQTVEGRGETNAPRCFERLSTVGMVG